MTMNMADEEIRVEMSKRTYVVHHNPNCPSVFLVRMPTVGVMDLLPFWKTKDALGYGQTFEDAARIALRDQSVKKRVMLRKDMMQTRAQASRIRRNSVWTSIWGGMTPG